MEQNSYLLYPTHLSPTNTTFYFGMSNVSLPQINEIYEGRVKRIEAYGAFIELKDLKVTGLVHISQISQQRVEDIKEVLSLEEEVFVKVLSIEKKRDLSDEGKREGGGRESKVNISLSMKYCDQVPSLSFFLSFSTFLISSSSFFKLK